MTIIKQELTDAGSPPESSCEERLRIVLLRAGKSGSLLLQPSPSWVEAILEGIKSSAFRGASKQASVLGTPKSEET